MGLLFIAFAILETLLMRIYSRQARPSLMPRMRCTLISSPIPKIPSQRCATDHHSLITFCCTSHFPPRYTQEAWPQPSSVVHLLCPAAIPYRVAAKATSFHRLSKTRSHNPVLKICCKSHCLPIAPRFLACTVFSFELKISIWVVAVRHVWYVSCGSTTRRIETALPSAKGVHFSWTTTATRLLRTQNKVEFWFLDESYNFCCTSIFLPIAPSFLDQVFPSVN